MNRKQLQLCFPNFHPFIMLISVSLQFHFKDCNRKDGKHVALGRTLSQQINNTQCANKTQIQTPPASWTKSASITSSTFFYSWGKLRKVTLLNVASTISRILDCFPLFQSRFASALALTPRPRHSSFLRSLYLRFFRLIARWFLALLRSRRQTFCWMIQICYYACSVSSISNK